MRIVLLALLIGFITGCGMVYPTAVKTPVYLGPSDKDKEQDDRLDYLTDYIYDMFDMYNKRIDSIDLTLASLDSNMIAQIQELNYTVQMLQLDSNNLMSRIVELETNEDTITYINPCGDNFGYDEILLRLESGTIIGIVSSHGRKMLSVLTPGSYRTNDNSRCEYVITNNLQVCSGVMCE